MVVSLFGNSFVAVRVSVLSLQVGLFGAGMRLSRSYLAIGLASVVWINVDRGSTEENSVARYMADTISVLDEEYVILDDEFWMSPEQAQRCPRTAEWCLLERRTKRINHRLGFI